MSSEVFKILVSLKDDRSQADEEAEAACKQSRYSIQDDWMCLEFKLQRIHDQIAKEHGYERVPDMPFRIKLNQFRRSLME